MALYIGLMSGTSIDGVDGALADLPDEPGAELRVLAHHHLVMPAALRRELLSLNSRADDELHRAALASNALSACYADVVGRLLQDARLQPQRVRALGAHGQTVRHCPGEFDGSGYTLQLLNGALLAELSGIDVVCDFRSRDVASGGQGAPLVPAFHAAVWAHPGRAQAVLNLGGIANLSLLGAEGQVGGFDCGPGNALLDLWCERHLGQPFDSDGAWAAGGQVDPGLLAHLMSEPFFAKAPPKSTGRELFNAGWLDGRLAASGSASLRSCDVQATLAELTVRSVVSALRRYAPAAQRLLVCGGGAYNGHLMQRLGALMHPTPVESTAAHGLPPSQVEAVAFAWLARARVLGLPGNRPEVTGARGLRVLGALHRAA